MEVNIYTVIYLAGALQAIILGAVLFKRKHFKRHSHRYLLGLLFSIFLVLVQYSLTMNEIVDHATFVWPLGTAAWYTIGPLMFLYTYKLAKPEFSFQWYHLFLFLFAFYHLVQYFVEASGIYFGFHLLFDSWPIYSYAWLITYHVYALLFGGASLFVIQNMKYANPAQNPFRWLNRYLVVYLVGLIILMSILIYTANAEVYSSSYEWLFIGMYELFIFAVVIQSLRTSAFLEDQHEINEVSTTSLGLLQVGEQQDANPNPTPKYANSVLGRADLEEIHQKLDKIMAGEQLFLDPKLSLSSLSEKSRIPENHLSQLFSQLLDGNFYDFVNEYRLREIELRLSDPKYRHLKIASLAEDCGFNSKSSFYRYFKSVHQMTPTAYLKSRGEKVSSNTE